MPVKRKCLLFLIFPIVLLTLTIIILSLLPGSRQGYSVLSELFAPRVSSMMVSELSFDVGRSRVFAHSNGFVASAGTLGLQVLGSDGRESLRESFRITTPALTENNGYFLCFDIGGRSVRAFNSHNVLTSIETEDSIVSSSINRNGWLCIVTQAASGGARGTVGVYNSDGKQVFDVVMGSGYVLSAKLSDDNSRLAILNITENGSRITIYDGINISRNEPEYVFMLGDELFIDMAYMNSDSMLCIGTQSVLIVDITDNSPIRVIYNFDEKRLGGYTYTEQFIALHLFDYSIGYSGQIITVDYNGAELGQIEVSSEITSMTSCDDTLILLNEGSVSFHNKYLDTSRGPDGSVSVATAGRVLALSKELALAANDLSAVVVRSS